MTESWQQELDTCSPHSKGRLINSDLLVLGDCVCHRYARQLAEPYVLGKWQALKKGVQLECDLARDVERELTLDAVLPKKTQRLQDVSGCGCRPPLSIIHALLPSQNASAMVCMPCTGCDFYISSLTLSRIGPIQAMPQQGWHA